MIKRDLVNRVIERTGLTRAQSRIAVETILDEMRGSMVRGERIELRGFGVFYTRPRKTGVGRNPKTGEEVPIPPGKTVRFKPGKHMSVSSSCRVATRGNARALLTKTLGQWAR